MKLSETTSPRPSVVNGISGGADLGDVADVPRDEVSQAPKTAMATHEDDGDNRKRRVAIPLYGGGVAGTFVG